MPQQFQTKEQVQQYLARIFPSQQFEAITPIEHGWICRPKLTSEEIARGQDLGLSTYIVNKQTGVVTTHPSLPPFTIGQMYDEAIRTGDPVQGGQIYPPLWRVNIRRTREDSQTIQYHVLAQSMAQPPEPTAEYQLTIDKNTFAHQPAASMAMNVVSWTEWRSRQDGTWPMEGTFEE
ncbi:hypothetical protein ACLMAJ_26940 [Nocardia sp. KC 131]|uniref:hypothetical protein n=1 Tax=Nocardia arseniciresistens TaxID=3392119 RepID=UPI00398F3D00